MNISFNKNEDHNKLLWSSIRQKFITITFGGGKKQLQKIRDQGKMTARERIKFLIDSDTEALEIGAFAAEGMYEKYNGCPAAGVVVVLGYIQKRLCVIVANDASVKAGAWFPMTGKKNLRAQKLL